MREWFQVKLQADPAVAEIHIIDYIGGWIDQTLNEMFGETVTVTAKAFAQALAAIPEPVKTLKVHVNSPGGDLHGAVNIANSLRAWATKGRKVETIVDGMAASAASLVVMAGDPVRISDNGLLMIHLPWTVAAGNSKEMRQAADDLDKFRDSNIIPTYQWHTQLSAEEITALMDVTTWMDAQEAVAMGFADEVVQGLRAAASIDPRTLAKLTIPEKYAARVKALLAPKAEAEPEPPAPEMPPEPEPDPVADPVPVPEHGVPDEIMAAFMAGDEARVRAAVEAEFAARLASQVPAPKPAPADAAAVVKACGEAGLELEFAQAAIADGVTAEVLAGRIASEKQVRAAAQARETEIRALCKVAKQDDLADAYVTGGMQVKQVRQHLTLITAKLDQAEIDGGLEPDHGTRRKPVIDVTAVYAELNKPRLLKE